MSPIRTRRPVSVEEMKTRLGMRDHGWGTLKDVQSAKGAISDWAIQAAWERWPELIGAELDDYMERAYDYAEELWPGFKLFCASVQEAERNAWRKVKATA